MTNIPGFNIAGPQSNYHARAWTEGADGRKPFFAQRLVYSCIYPDLVRGLDTRGRADMICAVYGLVFRGINAVFDTSNGKGADPERYRSFVIGLIYHTRTGAVSIREGMEMFHRIQGLRDRYDRSGAIYPPGTDEEIEVPVIRGDEILMHAGTSDSEGGPYCFLDYHLEHPTAGLDDAKAISSKRLRLGTVRMKGDEALDLILSPIGLCSRLSFDDGCVTLDLSGHPDGPDAGRRMDADEPMSVVVLESAPGRNPKISIEVDKKTGMRVRRYSYRRPDSDVTSERYDPMFSPNGEVDSSQVSEMLRDIAGMDVGPGGRTLVLIGATSKEIDDVIDKLGDKLLVRRLGDIDQSDDGFIAECMRIIRGDVSRMESEDFLRSCRV